MGRHCNRYIAWWDPFATGDRWVVIDLHHDNPSTSSGKDEVGRFSNSEKAHSFALEMELADDSC